MTFPYLVGVGPSTNSAPDIELSVFESWTLNRNLDDGCTLSFVCPGDSIAGLNISELATDVWLYRFGVPEQRFRVLEVEQTWDADGRDDIAVTAVCYRRIFASRHVLSPLSYTATSQGDIVWNLIQHTQGQTNGGLGVTLGSSGPALLRDRAYDVGQNILEAITDLSKIEDGIVWDVNENLEVIVTTADAFPIRSQPVVLGVNVDGMTRPSGAALFGNVALVSGDAVSTSIQINAAPTLGTDPRGRWERYVGIPSEKDQTALVEAADGLLEESQSPAVVWSLSVIPDRYFSESDFALGDFVTIVPPISLVAPLTPSTPVEAQIVTQEITVSPDGEVQVVMNAIETTHPELASVDTDAVTSILTTSATLNGDLISVGTGVLLDQGFVYSTSPDPVIGGVGVTQVSLGVLGVGAFSDGQTGLVDDTTYYVKAYAITTVGTSYGDQVSFATLANISVEYLVIGGGGGGGGAHAGGGGGAGGYRSSIAGELSGANSTTLSPHLVAPFSSVLVVVGGGGSAGYQGVGATAGTLSTFDTSLPFGDGGGRGGQEGTWPGGNGGAGGGGSGDITAANRVGGSGASLQGANGGAGNVVSGQSYGLGGGGGGTRFAGANASGLAAGNGGAGTASSVTGVSVTRGGGGGGGGWASIGGTGGAGGAGGGGAGSGTTGVNGGNGSPNTGSGGGGSNSNTGGTPNRSGGNGGSGVVILRYPSTYTIVVGGGLTSSTTTIGPNKVTVFTAGIDFVSWF